MQKNTNNRFFGKRAAVIAFLCALVGILLIIMGNCRADDKNDKESGIETLDPEAYAREVEEKVEELCNKIDGVSSTYAIVTLEGGYKAIYATDTQAGGSSAKKQTVTLGSGSGEHALLLGYENPKIAGIGIVCSGGDDPICRQNVISVVSSAFDVSTNKIFVTGS
jgi:stage III sporulation protein AG